LRALKALPDLADFDYTHRGKAEAYQSVNAAFAAFGGVKSKVMKTEVPQYAMLTDDGGREVPAIVMQAEIVEGQTGKIKTYAVRPVGKKKMVVAVNDQVRLLGTKRPVALPAKAAGSKKK
jgi:hypothetical protein